jgi:hypothetical protein
MEPLSIDELVVERGRRAGYDLVQREMPSGKLVWTIRDSDDATQPCFLNRHAAIEFLQRRLRLSVRHAF